MRTKAKRAAQTIRHLGPRWALYRAGYALQQKSGWLARRLPATSWSDQPLASFLGATELADPTRYFDYRCAAAPPFFFDTTARPNYAALLRQWDVTGDCPQRQADNLLAGTLRYFDHLDLDVGCPPDWHGNALTGERAPADVHWSRLDDFGFGDIKAIWEPSRFGFTYSLVRAYWRSGDVRYADCFWQLVEDWQRHNPPQQGVNWKCGQETSLRVMAWCFGLYGFLDAPVTTPARVATLAQMIAVSGVRIETNLDYALSQRNNHGISEGMGLWTIGLLFPEFRQTARWRERGHTVLEQLGVDLIYPDGSFVQHSVNYHRLMLQNFIWAVRLGELHGYTFSSELRERLEAAHAWLFQVQDQASGRVPWYGQTDGAHVLPLANCDYLDMRPVVQAGHYLTQRARRYDAGPWDEPLLWLFGHDAVSAPVNVDVATDFRADDGGYYTLRGSDSFAFVRCATFRDRPGQADMLHVDLWHQGVCLAGDAGTFSYNAPTPWNNPLAGTGYHNTVTVDGLDQMDRAGKFLWLPWLRSQVRTHARLPQGPLAYWEGEHDGYVRLPDPVRHRRAILAVGDDGWLVLDRLDGVAPHDYRLHWLLHPAVCDSDPDARALELQHGDGLYHLQILDPSGAGNWSLVTADPESPRGWRAPYYHARQPASSLAYTLRGGSVMLGTWFGLQPVTTAFTASQWSLRWSTHTLVIELGTETAHTLATAINLQGAISDKLEL